MGKKDKVDPAEGAEVAPEYQAGVLAMARARMEASNADAEQGLAEAAAQTQRQRETPGPGRNGLPAGARTTRAVAPQTYLHSSPPKHERLLVSTR